MTDRAEFIRANTELLRPPLVPEIALHLASEIVPIWRKTEEGEPVPGPQAAARFEEGFLGRYGLYFGNGYLIHGTLFQRFLGQSVTHGCVRLGDADLEKVFENSKVGTKIFIY